MFKFITGKPLWANILFAIGLVLLLLLIFLMSLNFITHHGKTLSIPGVTGKTFTDAKKALEGQGFDVEVQDSVYVDTLQPLMVLRQFPEADAQVKVNRTVYLTINRAVPPTIEMPQLEGLSFRNAGVVLQQYGLKLKDTSYRPDFAKNAVLEQQYNGERIKPGTKISMGSGISLVLGSGLGQEQFAVPDLFGMTYTEARTYLESNGLSLGAVVSDAGISDTTNAYVRAQRPERMSPDQRVNMIRQGQSVDIWLTGQRPARNTDSTQHPANQY